MNQHALPTERDFDPFEGCLDAQSAWKHFGGKTLDEAYQLFCSNPLHYQEDFMFMGHAALAFYFPVLARYLRTGGGQPYALIIAKGLDFQFDNDDTIMLGMLKQPIIELANLIVHNSQRYGDTAQEQMEITHAWKALADRLG